MFVRAVFTAAQTENQSHKGECCVALCHAVVVTCLTMCFNCDPSADRNYAVRVRNGSKMGGGAVASMTACSSATPTLILAMCSCLRNLVRTCLVPEEVRARSSQVSSKFLTSGQSRDLGGLKDKDFKIVNYHNRDLTVKDYVINHDVR